jgi:hypothetical protein
VTYPDKALVLVRNHHVELLTFTFISITVVVAVLFGFPALLLFFAFALLVVALGLAYSTLSNLGQVESMTLDEALEYAALTHNEERKLSVLRGLKDLEYEHALGKISDEDYATLSRRYRQQARNLLEQLDSDDADLKQRVLDSIEERIGAESAREQQVDDQPSKRKPVKQKPVGKNGTGEPS